MAAGYNSKKVEKKSAGVEWEFNATAASSQYYFVKVVCNGQEATAEAGATASVKVTGSAAYGSADYNAGSKTYTVEQFVRSSYEEDWPAEPESTATVTVSWDTATLRVVVSGTVTACSNIKVVSGGEVKTVTAVYSVQNGEVKLGI